MSSDAIIAFIRKTFRTDNEFIPLHAPVFHGNEKAYLNETIDSTFVSSVGPFVNKFEADLATATGARYCVAITNGTTALHLAMIVAGVKPGDEVLTQSLTFVATANAISHIGARPVFIDVDKDTMSMSPAALSSFLQQHVKIENGRCINKVTGNPVTACIPMHSFGFPGRIDEIAEICREFRIPLVEDAAESLGSYYKGIHTGNFGLMGVFSFNGNKIVTCGGGGAIITNDEAIAQKAKHLSTTAKVPHAWEFVHDEVAFNYRMPNLNAALACAQLEQLDTFLASKRKLAGQYRDYFLGSKVEFVYGIRDSLPNYWLNTILFPNPEDKEAFLQDSNAAKVMTRPAWQLMHKLRMYENCYCPAELINSEWLSNRLVNIPSSVIA